MRYKNTKVLKVVRIALLPLVFLSAIGFVGKQQNGKIITKIDIDIDNHYDSYFIDENDIMNMITENGNKKLIGTPFSQLNLKEIEVNVSQHKFVQNAEVYKDLQGTLVVNVEQSVPIARVVQTDGPDAYISDRGHVLPVSEKFTARVIVVGGEYTPELVKKDLPLDSASFKIFDLLQYIEKDKFWKTQIAQLDIDKTGDITLYPQVGKQIIEFGKAEDVHEKFNKLNIFYKQILPQKGWNAYERVNLKFKNQIVCE